MIGSPRQVKKGNALRPAGGPGSASIDTFATTRADIQARNTYNSISQQAMTWVPILNIVLTVVFYAMFPVIFPLFLMPQTGVQALKGYLTGSLNEADVEREYREDLAKREFMI